MKPYSNEKLKVLSLFCGAAGGMDLGLERAGFRTVAACEIDPWRQRCFCRNFPGVKIYGDIRDVSATVLARDGIAVDVVAGSPPCQDASTANTKGRGVDGERTGLFFEFVRLVGELRPRWIVAENVPGIRTRGIDRILAALEREGYAVWPLVVGAWHAGAPHRRNRVWIVAAAADSPCDGRRQKRPWRPAPNDEGQQQFAFHDPDPALLLWPALAGREPDGDSAGVAADADGDFERREQKSGPGGLQEVDIQSQAMVADAESVDGRRPRPDIAQPEFQIGRVFAQWQDWNGGPPNLGRVDDGLPRGVARAALAAYGDSVVPQIVEAIGRAIMRVEGRLRSA